MFQSLKTPHNRDEEFKDMTLESSKRGFHRSPGTSYSVIKGNETRLVRCVHCGFICDRERDVRLPDDSWAGLGINYGAQLTAGTAVSDVRSLSGNGAKSADKYYERTVSGGCPGCGSFTYDRKPDNTGSAS